LIEYYTFCELLFYFIALENSFCCFEYNFIHFFPIIFCLARGIPDISSQRLINSQLIQHTVIIIHIHSTLLTAGADDRELASKLLMNYYIVGKSGFINASMGN